MEKSGRHLSTETRVGNLFARCTCSLKNGQRYAGTLICASISKRRKNSMKNDIRSIKLQKYTRNCSHTAPLLARTVILRFFDEHPNQSIEIYCVNPALDFFWPKYCQLKVMTL